MGDHMLSPEKWRDFWRYYKGTPEQVEAVNELYVGIHSSDPCLLHDNASWVRTYRAKPEVPAPGTLEISNTWHGIKDAARIAGAKFPECVSAQWALESAYGKQTSGKNNFFGIKGRGTSCTTWEDYGNGPVTVQASFRDFDSIQDCVSYLVDRWYLDFKGYRGVNRASSAHECCQLLKVEGYATDPAYVSKLCSLIDQHQ